MADPFRIGDISVGSGEIGRGAIARLRLADSQEIKVPVIVVNGKKDGPTLLVVSGVHGREVSSIGALLDAIKKMDPISMSGRVVAIPVANPLAVQVGSYITPHDNINLSSPTVFPANPKTTVTQRMAAGIEQAIRAADYAIDMHANAQPSIPLVFTCYSLAHDDRIRRDTRRFAESFGVTVTDMVQNVPEDITGFATRQGKPAFRVQLAGDRFLWDSIMGIGTRGILNAVKFLGILPGQPESQIGVSPILKGEFVVDDVLNVNVGGFLRVYKNPGEFVRAGEQVASVFDYYGDVLENIAMRVDGYCYAFPSGGYTHTWAVTEGESIAYIIKEVR